MTWRPIPTPYFPNKPAREAAATPGPRIYAGRRRLRIEPTGEAGRYRLVDSEGHVRFEGPQSAVEHHIGEQLRLGRYKALR